MSKTLNYQTYYDKVLGGWIGKCAGGILGAPIEGYKSFNDIELSDKLFETNFPNDDLDLQILWLDMVKEKGPKVRENDFADHWRKYVRFPWNEYGVAYRNLELGLAPPLSGQHNNHYWYRGMGSPIRSEIWGMLCPGMPERAAYYAQIDSSLDHHAFSVEAERFLSACAAEAFFVDDIHRIFDNVLPLFKQDSAIYQLVNQVSQWHKSCTYQVAMHKIKGLYGDADFTSAPMNVAFTILALMHAQGDFDSIMDALHMGHDSDCIVATTGALLGIMSGYQNISEKWRELVGNELLVSQEIVGLEHANTIEQLAEETCQAGIQFIQHFQVTELENAPLVSPLKHNPTFHLHVEKLNTDFINKPEWKEIHLVYENLSSENQQVTLVPSSQQMRFDPEEIQLAIQAGETHRKAIRYQLTDDQAEFIHQGSDPQPSSLSYQLTTSINGKQEKTLHQGIPYYGSWLLIGPFILDNPDLVPMDEQFPDHGLASLPSSLYMNHDKVDFEREFVTGDEVRQLALKKNFNEQSFLVQKIYSEGFKMNLGKYYVGRGERTLYLYSQIRRKEADKVWTVLGCSGPMKVWINGQMMCQQEASKRSWPHATSLLTDLKAGQNDILIRIDVPLDQVDFEIGFKQLDGKHAHQSLWSTDIIPTV